MDWLWLALLSASSLAVADAVSKFGLRDIPIQSLVVMRFALAAIGITPLAAMQTWIAPPPEFWFRYALLLPMEIAAAWLYLHALRASPMSLALPMLAFTPALLVPSAWLLLGERPGTGGVAGIALIVAGAYLLGLKAGATSIRWWQPFSALGRETGVRYMLLTAVLYAMTTPVAKAAMAQVTPLQFAALYFWGLTAVSLVVFRSRNHARPMESRHIPGLLLLAVTMTTMIAAHFMALAMAPAAYMIAVKRTSLLFGILMGVLWFGEGQGRRRIAAGALMVFGVLAIAVFA